MPEQAIRAVQIGDELVGQHIGQVLVAGERGLAKPVLPARKLDRTEIDPLILNRPLPVHRGAASGVRQAEHPRLRTRHRFPQEPPVAALSGRH